MSDAVVTGLFGIAIAVITYLLNKRDRRDRAKASTAVATKNTELEALRSAHATELAALRSSHAAELAQRDSTIAWLRRQLETRGVMA